MENTMSKRKIFTMKDFWEMQEFLADSSRTSFGCEDEGFDFEEYRRYAFEEYRRMHIYLHCVTYGSPEHCSEALVKRMLAEPHLF